MTNIFVRIIITMIIGVKLKSAENVTMFSKNIWRVIAARMKIIWLDSLNSSRLKYVQGDNIT